MAVQVADSGYLVAKFESPCATCGKTIETGCSMFPASDCIKGDARYHHLACALEIYKTMDALLASAPVCKHWERLGVCFYRDRCVFRHPKERLEELQRIAEQQAALKAARRTTNDVRCIENRGPGKRNRVRNRFRAGTLRRWLLDGVGEDLLRRGTGVLDVAAGKGELAFEFVNLNGIPATALEPRVLQLQRHVKWLERGYYNWNAVFKAYNTMTTGPHRSPEQGPPEARLPDQLRLVVTPALSACLPALALARREGGPEASRAPAAWHEAFGAARMRAFDLRWTHKGLQPDHEAGVEEVEVAIEDKEGSESIAEQLDGVRLADGPGDDAAVPEAGTTAPASPVNLIEDAERAWQTLLGCSAVVAMHPDQATEFAVDLALALDAPFAVVPCCVYASDFPRRRLPDGRRVTSYDDFLDYLSAKDPAIQIATLPFEGKNKVVYRWCSADAQH